jgi:hypothetical protein
MPNPNPATRKCMHGLLVDELCQECDEGVYGDDDYEELCCECGGEGYIEGDCFEDTCCCADPITSHGFILCPNCGGN